MTPRYKITVRDYGEGDAEVSWGRSRLNQGKKAVRGESKNREANIEHCVGRAKAMVRRKVLSARLDHLLSMTYRANVTDKQRATADFEKFIRLVHAHYPDWRYVMVPEKQKRGAYHFHLAVKGYQNVVLLRSLWRGIVGEGNIDVQYRKTGKGAQWKKGDLARYLAKYVGKDMESELNERRYRCSLGIEIPAEETWIPVRTRIMEHALQKWVIEYAVQKLKAVAGHVTHVWCPEESNGDYGWACSWG